MPLLGPDRYFSRITHIDIKRDLLAVGCRHILLDVDNTILPRDTSVMPRDVGVWLGRVRDAGISICLLSNNWHQNVYELAKGLDLPIVAKAVKPLPPAFLMARSKIGAKRTSTIVIGDQLVTDVLGAHFLGMKAYMLTPLVQQDLKHTLILRNFEHWVMGDRVPEGAAASVSCTGEESSCTDAAASSSEITQGV